MKEARELTCINCPMGCQLSVVMEDGIALLVTGNSCPKGDSYARKEVTFPTRIVTSTVAVEDGDIPRASVKTASDIPKGKIFDIMEEIRKVTLHAPVSIGDVVIENVSGTGVNVIATKDVPARPKP